MIMPQQMRRSGYDDDPGWLRLSTRVAEETGPVRTYRLRPDEMAQMFPSTTGSTAQGGAKMRGTKFEPGLRLQAQQLSDGGMARAAIARKLKVPYSTVFGWLSAASPAPTARPRPTTTRRTGRTERSVATGASRRPFRSTRSFLRQLPTHHSCLVQRRSTCSGWRCSPLPWSLRPQRGTKCPRCNWPGRWPHCAGGS